jgi:hypothetical protein
MNDLITYILALSWVAVILMVLNQRFSHKSDHKPEISEELKVSLESIKGRVSAQKEKTEEALEASREKAEEDVANPPDDVGYDLRELLEELRERDRR